MPIGGVETLESNFPHFFLRQSHKSVHVWLEYKQQIVAQVVDQFKDQVSKGKHDGTEIISLMSSLS